MEIATTTMQDLVSIVIPAFNAAPFIERTLRSACAQTHAAIEILVVDDGSTDDTAALVERLAASDARITLFRKPNGGVASARNLGLQQARAEWVTFLDADDLWHPSKVARQLKYVKGRALNDGGAAVMTYNWPIDAHDRIAGVPFPPTGLELYSLPSHLVIHPVGNGSNILVRRDIALAVGGYDPSYIAIDAGGCEDLDFELALTALYPIGVLREFLVGYRTHDGNMSSNLPRMARAMAEVTRRHIERHPQLPSKSRRWAWGVAHYYSMTNHRRAGLFYMAVRQFLLYCWQDPVIVLRRLFPRWAKALIRAVIPWRRRQKPGHLVDGPLFFEASTTFDQKDKMRAFDRRRIRYLIRADLAWRKNSGRPAAT
jgi:glycosyltransferase involved in cell wall biosynthesis